MEFPVSPFLHLLAGDIFAELAPLTQSVLDGFNASVFAYGQTGSGKTYESRPEQKNFVALLISCEIQLDDDWKRAEPRRDL